MMAVFNRIWAGMWSARMEYILNNTLLALLETPGNTLLGVVRMLTDKDFRAKIIKNVQDPMVRNFWNKEFASFNDKYRTEAIAPVLNKIGQFFSTDLIRNILGQTKSSIDMREIMDKKRILIVNLSKGRLGEDNSEMLGSLLVTKIQLAAMSRVDIPEEERNDFYLYVDEFQNFTTDSFATILSEARKYRLNLILAHQYISQLTESGNEKVKNAIFGNVGTMICFRVGSEDALKLEQEFEPVFTTQQLINLNKHQIALKLSIDGKATDPFLANTLAPVFDKLNGRTSAVVAISRERYGVAKDIIKDKINRWLSEESESEEETKPQQPQFTRFNTGSINRNPRFNSNQNSTAQNSSPARSQTNSSQTQTTQASTQNPSSASQDPAKKKRKKPNPFLSGTRDDRQKAQRSDDKQNDSDSTSQLALPANNDQSSQNSREIQAELPKAQQDTQLPLKTSSVNLHLNKLQALKQARTQIVNRESKFDSKPAELPKEQENMFELPR
jgi:hypothetical protein